jgi:hypothetical protein
MAIATTVEAKTSSRIPGYRSWLTFWMIFTQIGYWRLYFLPGLFSFILFDFHDQTIFHLPSNSKNSNFTWFFFFFRYYQYDGSLTTPPCHEDVIWTIIADECTVSQDFVNWLGEKNTMNNNYRAIQPLNERQIDHCNQFFFLKETLNDNISNGHRVESNP